MTAHRIDQNIPGKYARERFQLKETIVTISAEERHNQSQSAQSDHADAIWKVSSGETRSSGSP
ncbi:hypothetical protein CW696_01010 [ANME-2 cluster archaeon]|nr:MAG: hypothetical protein CW696_01010 [ANME-2 cluster archaeon]